MNISEIKTRLFEDTKELLSKRRARGFILPSKLGMFFENRVVYDSTLASLLGWVVFIVLLPVFHFYNVLMGLVSLHINVLFYVIMMAMSYTVANGALSSALQLLGFVSIILFYVDLLDGYIQPLYPEVLWQKIYEG